MKIKNNYTSHIGFGTVRILPGETLDMGALPDGYDDKHPVIKFYISKGWLGVVGKPAASETDESEADGVEADGVEADGVDGQVKGLARMTLESLRNKAKDLGIGYVNADTKAVLVERITEKLQGEKE